MAPRWVVRLLARVVPEERHDDVIGDLEELHGRRVARWGRLAAGGVTVCDGLLQVVAHTFRAVGRAATAGSRWVSGAELRLALRLVRKQPVMTLTSVVALGAGIGIVAGAFSVFQQGIYGELPFANGDRWVTIESYAEESGARTPMDLQRLRIFRSSASAVAYVAGTETSQMNVVHATGEVERIEGAQVTPGIFRYLPYRPLLGRLLVPADGASGAEPVALIRESLWLRRFSRDMDVVGRSIDIAGADHLIVGVLPDDAEFPGGGEIWLPLHEEDLGAADDRASVGSRFIAILAEGATPAQAQAQLAQLSSQAAAPGSGAEALRLRVTPLTRVLVSPQIQVAILVFMSVLLAVFLVIAANVGNLVVARTSRRSAELAVRTALGASRPRLVGQIFAEMLVIGGLASVLGLAAAGGILAVYDRVLDELPFWVHLGLRPSTAVAVVVLAVLAAGVTGIVPALRATRKDPADALRGAGRGGALGIGRVGGFMIAAEVALSVALLGGAALFARGFQLYLNPTFQLPDDRVLTARLVLDLDEAALVEGGAATVADSLATVLRTLQQDVAALPGVAAVGVASHLPRTSPYPEPLEVEGRPDLLPTPLVAMGPGLLDVLEVRPLVGRDIDEGDLRPGAPPVALVNESFALATYGTTQVLGRRLREAPEADQEDAGPWREIVGVVPDVMEVAGPVGAAGVYVPLRTRRFVSLALRVESDPLALTGRLRRAVFDVDPDLNVSEIVRLDGVGSENRIALQVMSSALTGIGVITLLLSLAGVYSIVSLAVTQRTREIGVRVALGAEPGRILWSVLRRSGLLILGGAVVGAVAGHQASKVRLFVFAVPEAGGWFFPGLVLVMALAGLMACWVPARRALSIQPVEALRYDD
jgi:predicted permease